MFKKLLVATAAVSLAALTPAYAASPAKGDTVKAAKADAKVKAKHAKHAKHGKKAKKAKAAM